MYLYATICATILIHTVHPKNFACNFWCLLNLRCMAVDGCLLIFVCSSTSHDRVGELIFQLKWFPLYPLINTLIHWGPVKHICFSKLTFIYSDNGLLPGQCQAIIWASAEILLIQSLRTNYSEFLSEIHTFQLKKMHLKMSSAKWRQFCLDLFITQKDTPIIWDMEGMLYSNLSCYVEKHVLLVC